MPTPDDPTIPLVSTPEELIAACTVENIKHLNAHHGNIGDMLVCSFKEIQLPPHIVEIMHGTKGVACYSMTLAALEWLAESKSGEDFCRELAKRMVQGGLVAMQEAAAKHRKDLSGQIAEAIKNSGNDAPSGDPKPH